MNTAQLLELIVQDECARVEFKSSFQKEAIETLAAFANAHGGAVLMDDLTVEKIKTGHYKSHLRNKQVASIFRELDLIEKYGSGVRRVIDAFVAYGLPEPEFEATQGGMAVTVFKNAVKAATAQPPEIGKVTDKTSVKILSILLEEPETTIPELAIKVGLTTCSIERALTKLQLERKLVRIGADKGGHWKVLIKS
jgi:ATP-dependent DNA helicase RecG